MDPLAALDVLAQLRDSTPDVVVDASGPFQIYGEDPYAVVKACIALKIPYLDLADGSAFVNGIAAFDGDAKSSDVFVLAGVSSFPVLTAAVVRELSPDMARIEQAARSRLGDARFAEAAREGTRVSWSQLAQVTLAS